MLYLAFASTVILEQIQNGVCFSYIVLKIGVIKVKYNCLGSFIKINFTENVLESTNRSVNFDFLC